ncbi:MAG: DoxX family membrane protein [Bacteroidetes bacterium]|nr:DoxX family membrane protein [Bacteroidota bacterium]
MNNSNISRIGVILYALVIGFFGVNHFMNASGMAPYVPAFFHGGEFWVYLTGAALIAAAIAFLIGKQTRLAGLLLAVFLIVIVLTIHLPAVMHAPDEAASRVPLTNLIKDTGLAAAALIIAGKGNMARA